MHRIRPYPHPTRPETKWMTSKDIKAEYMGPSSGWIHTGSGKLARIYLEILQCDRLPNTDVGQGVKRNKTDPFVTLVYEDATRRTDVISDCCSPKRMPWTQRAFLFHMAHPSSQIFLGIFDYDRMSNHDYLGKVSVDITRFRPQTNYILDYAIFDTLMDKEPKQIGKEANATIKIRLRIEVNDQQALVLASLTPPPGLYINIPGRKHFHAVSSSVNGAKDLSEYNIEHIIDIVTAIIACLECKEYIIVAFTNTIMW